MAPSLPLTASPPLTESPRFLTEGGGGRAQFLRRKPTCSPIQQLRIKATFLFPPNSVFFFSVFSAGREREDFGAIILPKDGFEHFLLCIFETWLPSSGPLQPSPSGMPTAHLPLCPPGALHLTPGLSQGGPATYRLTRLNPDTVLLLTPPHTVPLVSDSLKP